MKRYVRKFEEADYSKWELIYFNKQGKKVTEYRDKSDFKNAEEADAYVQQKSDWKQGSMIDIGLLD